MATHTIIPRERAGFEGWKDPARRWLVAAVIAAVAMFGWLTWHAVDAVGTLEHLRRSHARAAAVHDSILRLEADVQRTVQLALATGEARWLDRHAEAEGTLRAVISDLRLAGGPNAAALGDALGALDELGRIEAQALSLLAAGRREEGFALVTGPRYAAGMTALGSAIARFDDGYHGWLLSHSLGLTREELVSLAGALLLFSVAIGAWVLLVRRLQREKDALLREAEARSAAEAGLQRAQKMELLGQLAGGVAHDVDNTLSAIAGYSSLALRAPDPAARERALAGLDRAVRQGRGLTSNLLAFVRHERAARRPVELGAMVREMQAWLAPLLPANIALEMEISTDDELWMEADPVSLQQAFVNLALNARDAMSEGGTLQVRLCVPEKRAAGDHGDGFGACIAVSDTGCGMDAETLAKAREPLFSTKRDGCGTGLGLPSVERVVEAHGGRLELESRPGAGTRARMLLPAAVGGSPSNSSSLAALLVSPDRYAGRLLADALADAGLAVTRCRRFDEPPARDARPGVVVIDWRDPPVDAIAVLRALRASGLAAPVILLLDDEDTRVDPSVEPVLADLAMVVARSVPLGALGQLALRLAARAGDADRVA